MARTPFEFDFEGAGIPALAAEFPEGTKVLSVADPIDGGAGDTDFYFSRRLNCPAGNYSIKLVVDDSATVWAGPSMLSTRMVASGSIGPATSTDFYLPAGICRFDLIVHNGSGPCYIAFSLLRNGEPFYTTEAPGWVVATAPISDEDVPLTEDPRLSLPVFSVLPNWKDGIVERLSWLTDVMTSETGAEQRRAVRRHPRRSLEASFLRQRAQRARLDMFFVGVGEYECLVPLWHEQVKMLDGITAGASGVAFSTNSTHMREFRTGDLVLVNDGNPDDYMLLEVGEVEPSRFGWKESPGRSWPIGTRIYPLREARIRDAPQLSSHTESVGSVQVRFELSKPDARVPSWGNTGGNPTFGFRPSRKQSLTLSYSRKSFELDNSAGQVQVTDPGDAGAVMTRFGLTLFGRSATYAFRQFIAAARGRACHFYCPTFQADLEALEDIDGLTPTLQVRNVGLSQYMSRPQPVRLMIALQYRDGDVDTIYRTITQAAPLVLGEQAMHAAAEILYLNEALPPTRLSEIKRISFVSESRFEQDTFELHHVTNGSKAVEASVVIRQNYNTRVGAPI